MKKNIIVRALLATALACGAALAHAQAANTWLIGVGVTQIKPHVSSGDLSAPSAPGTKIDARSDTQPTAWVARMLTDHWSVEVPIGFGFKHEIIGAGAIAGSGKIATVKALPVTVFGQYRFMEPNDRIRPYAMLGITYTHYYGVRGSAALNAMNPINPPGGTTMSVDSKWSLSPGIGVTIAITDKVFADAQYAHSFLKTTSHLSTGQSVETKVNPDMFRIGVGMRF
jgi:outer membrane protein